MVNYIGYFIVFSVAAAVFYFLKMTSWYVSWKLFFTKPDPVSKVPVTIVTIILPVRNEEKNISRCLDFLTAQNYPLGQLEIIVSDDFSSDQTTSICKKYISGSPSSAHQIKLIHASEDFGIGKKAAIDHAINHAKGQLIITTDADCTMGTEWVKSFVGIFEKSHPKMITGFVKIAPTTTFFSAMQAIEFLSLSASAAISIIREKPLMCNGANLAFTKTAFLEAGGYRYGLRDASGDDTYLMLKIAKHNSGAILFNKNRNGIVSTKPISNLQELISQRIRWASKIRNYKEGYIKRTGIFIFILNFILILLPVLAVAGIVPWNVTASVWIIKLIADLFILVPACLFSSQRNLLLLILPAGLIYPFYSFAGMLLSIGKSGYKWKDRSY